MRKLLIMSILLSAMTYMGCNQPKTAETNGNDSLAALLQQRVNQYVKVKLTADISTLTAKEKQMLPLLFDAAKIMDELFWEQAFGNKDTFINALENQAQKDFAMINYGPWERLNDNKSFVPKYGVKPAGANFYPVDMTKQEFTDFQSPDKNSLYTVIRRQADGKLVSISYHEEYKEKITKAADLIKQAAALAEDAGLKKYLDLRVEALLTSKYFDSDMAWMDMKTNGIDFVVGPIENYEDALFGYKAAFESFILIKDKEWSKKLDHFSGLLPELQKRLPVDAKYKAEKPASSSDLGAYDVVYYAGDCNAGSKTIAINLPNDEEVQLKKGSRRLQLKNSMKAKFDNILLPIGNMLIAEDQRQHLKFDAFFENVMFHEVAHGLGIKNTINNKGSVRDAMKEQYSALEEGKADILGLYIVTQLADMKELGEKDLRDNYVTFLAGIFRSVRFGAASAHGKANMVCFYFFEEKGAFAYDEKTGTYRVDFEKMKVAMTELGKNILVMQGNGDYDAAKNQIAKSGFIKEQLQEDLDRISAQNIPVDIIFEQGKEILGIQ